MLSFLKKNKISLETAEKIVTVFCGVLLLFLGVFAFFIMGDSEPAISGYSIAYAAVAVDLCIFIMAIEYLIKYYRENNLL